MGKRFTISTTALAGVHAVERHPIGDPRGFLTRLFCDSELAAAGWHKPVAQVNYTQTKLKGSIRGLHFQAAPKTEMKLVMCLAGSIHDVAIDLRRDSPTFLRTHQQILSQDNNTALLIPEGCAHGFQALTNDVALIYMHSMPFDADCERGFSAFDPKIGISWPLPVGPMSDRDCLLPLVGHDFHGI